MTTHSRRLFLAQTGGVALSAALAAVLPRPIRAGTTKLLPGIQLYTVNKPLLADPVGTLKALRGIGYRVVETAGFGTRSAQEFRKLLDDADLICPSAHLDFAHSEYGPLFDAAHALGAHYVVSSVLRPGSGALPQSANVPEAVLQSLRGMTLDDAKRTAEVANRIGKAAGQAGLQYAYHNHFMEFADLGNGHVPYDVLIQETDPELVKFEIDCGWMRLAGGDPVHYFRKYPHRFPMIHVKDFMPVDPHADNAPGPMERVGAELGTGFVDYVPILAAAKKAGLKYYFAEQEEPFTRMSQLEAAKVSYDYLRKID